MGNDTAKTITRAKTIVNAASAVSLTSVFNEQFNILLLNVSVCLLTVCTGWPKE